MKKFAFWILSFLLPLLSYPGAGGSEELSPNSAKECAICHFNWIDVFYKEGRSSDLYDYPKEKLVADEMMCYSCHDGSVNDSRFKVWETNRHKPGLKPSGKVRIPPYFPLDKIGTIQCFTCHTAHGVDTRPGIEATIFLRMSNKDSAMCRECHVGKDLGPGKGQHPVDVTSLDIPEEIIKAGGKMGTKKNKIICQTCHTPHGSTSEKFLIIPNSGKGITASALCETCHTVKPNIKAKGSMRAHSHPVDVHLIPEAKLPERWENGEVPYLSEDGRINCRTCHSPHNGISNNHILVQKNEKGSLCVICHTSKAIVANAKHNMEAMAPDEKNLEGKKASESGVCGACHLMHKGTAPKMWARPVAEGEDDPISKICKSCHSKGQVAGKKLTGDHTHPVGINAPGRADVIGLPLFDSEGKKVKEGKVTCASCHDVHQWDPASPDTKAAKDTEGDATNSFLRKMASPSPDICLRCHEDKGYVEKTSHDLNVTAPRALNANREPVKKSGICGACHLVHNAKGEKLWARTAGAGRDVIERLCSGCHTAGGIAEEKLTGRFSHPLGKTTAFTDPSLSLPLFNEKGGKDENGKVACATCHDVHRWDPMRKEKGPGVHVDGGRFNSFLRIPYDDEVSLCSNCHRNATVKGTKHDLHLTAPDEKNAFGEKAGKGPVCNPCHLVHKAKGAKLWAREIPPATEDTISLLCLSCHSDGKVAGKKQIGKNSHPLAKRIREAKDTLRRELEGFYSYSTIELPLFTKEGERSRDGQISCATCHNAHQWDPRMAAGGDVSKTEGDGGNSFLRKPSLQDSPLCGTCHTEKRYVFRTEHDMAVTAPGERNIQGNTVEKSGVCSACHLVHGGKESYKLWAKEPGEGDSPPMALCMSCHRKGGAAENKVPQYLKHPPDVMAIEEHKAGDAIFVPLYDNKGKESSSGYITCPSCHNPHLWISAQRGFGPGKNTEGRAINSFLRVRSSENMCKNCHGLQGMLRYKFYHTGEYRGGKAPFM